ncbi:MAG: YifB family Mg chelatase-like AAA ATPase [bacterium]
MKSKPPERVFSAANSGLNGHIVEVEADVSFGLRFFSIVGLPDKAVEEAKERVSTAVKSSSLSSPHEKPYRVLVNLAPADLKKEGSLYDLPIALAFLLATGQIHFNCDKKIFIGELALNGNLRPVKGILPIVMVAKSLGFTEVYLPKENTKEASLVNLQNDGNDFRVFGVANLLEVIDCLENRLTITPTKVEKDIFFQPASLFDIGNIQGQEYAKRALEITATGGHNLIMEGPPGTGKTLLARALPSILPSLSPEEALEVTKIYSIAGLIPLNQPLITARPFRTPHHSSSEAALIGGGNPPRPGEISLAHRGILFLDEFPEFHRDVLESLRQPLEEGTITVSRARHRIELPARFMLVAATNPCPCGYHQHPERQCVCTTSQVKMYRRKLSGPLIDRIDISINVPSMNFDKLTAPMGGGQSEAIKARVEKARLLQNRRFEGDGIITNAEMGIKQINKYCRLNSESQNLVRSYVNSGRLSARGYHRVLRVARTIADLDNSEDIKFPHLSEAVMYRLYGEA